MQCQFRQVAQAFLGTAIGHPALRQFRRRGLPTLQGLHVLRHRAAQGQAVARSPGIRQARMPARGVQRFFRKRTAMPARGQPLQR